MDSQTDTNVKSDGADEQEFKPLTAQEAQAWRKRQNPVSIMLPLLWQLVAGALVVGLSYVAFLSKPAIAWSALYGVVAVLIPSLLVARALVRQQRRALHPMAALASLMLWEGIKIVLTIALLLAAPRVLENLNWLALLLGFVVTVKAAWFGWWWQMKPSQPDVRNN